MFLAAEDLMTPDSRAILQGIAAELQRIERLAAEIGDDFLAFLVSSAAGEARDQLRDEALHQTGLVVSITRRVAAGGAGGATNP